MRQIFFVPSYARVLTLLTPVHDRERDRIGYWRWVRWPEYFQVPRFMFYTAPGVFWIDETLHRESLDARKEGRVFPPVTKTYDRWKKL